MEIVYNTLILAFNYVNLLNIVTVAIGLGLVIFFHELGHFLVAKWCGVYVERFSIGFGQPILSKKWGETEYALGWLPFGGYVKMMGQDDMDPAQMSDDQVAENPRSYTSKTVPQRMAIISAGVIMNLITGLLFFVTAFNWGIMRPDRVVGRVQPGMPAWINGLRSGDTITQINGRSVNDFDDLTRRTTLSSGTVHIEGFRRDGSEFQASVDPVKPEPDSIRQIIGVSPAFGLQLVTSVQTNGQPPTLPGSAASKATFEFEDQIVSAAGQPVNTYLDLLEVLDDHLSEDVEIGVLRRSGKSETTEATVTLPAQNFVGFGLRMGMGKIVAVQNGSPAEKAGIKPGDLIATVNGRDAGSDLEPFRLTEFFSENAGQTVSVTVTREGPGAHETLTFQLIPEDRPAWSEPPADRESPISIPSIGVAYYLVPTIFAVNEGSVAAEHQIKPRDTITKIEFDKKTADQKPDIFSSEKPFSIEIGDKNWAYAFWTMQMYAPTRKVTLSVKSPDSPEIRSIEIVPQPIADWYLPTTRGIALNYLRTERKATNISEAFSMGASYTVTCVEDIYLMLSGLFSKRISVKGLSGPIGIANQAYQFAREGLADFMLFLGLISVNLAVINFLPIPVLDGGHMVFLLYEGIFRRKPSERVLATATYCGLLFVLGLMLFVIFLDVTVKRH